VASSSENTEAFPDSQGKGGAPTAGIVLAVSLLLLVVVKSSFWCVFHSSEAMWRSLLLKFPEVS